MSEKKKIMERIKKLFALAGANPSEAEAMAALDKARALMIEHNFNEAELRQVEAQYVTKGYRSTISRASTCKKKFPKWNMLCAHVAKLNDCEAFTEYMAGETLFFGEAHDVEVSLFMMDLLRNAFVAAWRDYRWGQTKLAPWQGSMARVKTSFENGMLARLVDRLNQMIAEREVQVAGYSGGTALMVARGKAVAAAFDQEYTMPTARQKNLKSNDQLAALAGYQAGGQVNICTGIDEDRAQKLPAQGSLL